ncbi:unnamed protein product [Paramecium pentaurelia]|uniref:Uncharacterized protein n=1 Tax=Paramecium pentaurelia TaxID=43138 RepID=A0A8S1X4Z8_9CILI|nr:unnamed protein product [Paramecium pentaurelia]
MVLYNQVELVLGTLLINWLKLVFDADKNVKKRLLYKKIKQYIIKSLISYFESTTFSAISSFQFVQDSTNLRSYPSQIFDCSSTKFVGSLLYSEGMSFQFANSQSLQFIRLKISFYIKSFQTDNKIQIILDNQIQGEIIKTSSNFTFDKIKKIIVRVSLALILMIQSGQRQYQNLFQYSFTYFKRRRINFGNFDMGIQKYYN